MVANERIMRAQQMVAMLGLAASLGACGRQKTPAVECPLGSGEHDDYALIDRAIDERLFDDLSRFVAVETYRGGALSEAQVVANLRLLQADLVQQAAEFNQGQETHDLVPFEWTAPSPAGESWVFGFRLGTGQRKISLLSHLDTVPPGDDEDIPGRSWDPFVLQEERRDYLGREAQRFYVGRGAIDDKGPALVTFYVLKAVAQRYDSCPNLDDLTLEVLIDTAEETNSGTERYLGASPEHRPDLGIVYDATWCIRAEKGIERPVFTVRRGAVLAEGIWIESLSTPPGPVNQIPDKATAVIRGASPEALERFARDIEVIYTRHRFDDPDYRRANLSVDDSQMPERLVLETLVAGAQHGAAPEENRAEGANPLVSLAVFLGDLVQQGTLARNEVGEMASFLSWAWGTTVFGEKHPDLLQRNDDVFAEQNGTTYALTRLYTDPPGAPDIAVRLEIDIRYAIGHHGQGWDGEHEGLLPGDESIFASEVFPALLDRYRISMEQGSAIAFETVTTVPPDIRLPEGEAFQRISRAYETVMGKPCPALAQGSGTDAKGQINLIAAGPLSTVLLGYPINYHGFGEGAPVEDLEQGARILYRLFVDEIEAAARTGEPGR